MRSSAMQATYTRGARWFLAALALAACSSSSSTPATTPTTAAPVTTASAWPGFSPETAIAITDCYRSAQQAGKGWADAFEEAFAACDEASTLIRAEHAPATAEPETALTKSLTKVLSILRRGNDHDGPNEDDARELREAVKALQAAGGAYL